MKNTRKTFKRIVLIIMLTIFAIIVGTICINYYMIDKTKANIVAEVDLNNYIISNEQRETIDELDAQCIMVLGAAVNFNGEPSPVLKDRLDIGIKLYNAGYAPKILLTGDNGQVEYNEVEGMKAYILNQGVPEGDIVLDHAGFSTYESIHRARSIFEVDRMIVVTQKFHVYRALYGAERMGIYALGVVPRNEVFGYSKNKGREMLARDKDFIMWMYKPEPTFLGEKIPI